MSAANYSAIFELIIPAKAEIRSFCPRSSRTNLDAGVRPHDEIVSSTQSLAATYLAAVEFLVVAQHCLRRSLADRQCSDLALPNL
jgi:hypothetical protein